MDIQKIVTGTYVDLPRMLDARERRQAVQRQMLKASGLPLISFTLNIPGPIKVFPLAERTFEEGLRLIRVQCSAWRLPIRKEHQIRDITGREAFLSVDADPMKIKEVLCRLEERLALGRLFDLDVIRPDGSKISREVFHLPPRRCLVCGKEAFVCSRSRAHSVDEILRRECAIMTEYFDRQYARRVSSLSMAALLYEVAATPKPGLVDRDNSGAHTDMDFFTFQDSAVSLNQYFEEFTLCGIQNHAKPCPQVFSLIRPIGIQAEETMRQATGGVNTHKGMIFSLGVFCAALGYLYGCQVPLTEQALQDTCARMTAHLMDDFHGLTEETAKTHGEQLYVRFGVTGIRGEASAGYPGVFQLGLPVYRGYKNRGFSQNDAGVLTLLHILAGTQDTNVIARSDYDTMLEIRRRVRRLLDSGLENRDYLREIRQLDREFSAAGISPGGSADMLALTYFVDSLESLTQNEPFPSSDAS